MDVFYYWKNFDADFRAGRIGTFKVSTGKRRELADGYPDNIWAFRTPKGRKSELQLLACVRWVDQTGNVDVIAYDPGHPASVMFADSGSDAGIAAVTNWVGRHFPKMRSTNFHGASGQDAIRGAALEELQAIGATFTRAPFRPVAPAEPVTATATAPATG